MAQRHSWVLMFDPDLKLLSPWCCTSCVVSVLKVPEGALSKYLCECICAWDFAIDISSRCQIQCSRDAL